MADKTSFWRLANPVVAPALEALQKLRANPNITWMGPDDMVPGNYIYDPRTVKFILGDSWMLHGDIMRMHDDEKGLDSQYDADDYFADQEDLGNFQPRGQMKVWEEGVAQVLYYSFIDAYERHDRQKNRLQNEIEKVAYKLADILEKSGFKVDIRKFDPSLRTIYAEGFEPGFPPRLAALNPVTQVVDNVDSALMLMQENHDHEAWTNAYPYLVKASVLLNKLGLNGLVQDILDIRQKVDALLTIDERRPEGLDDQMWISVVNLTRTNILNMMDKLDVNVRRESGKLNLDALPYTEETESYDNEVNNSRLNELNRINQQWEVDRRPPEERGGLNWIESRVQNISMATRDPWKWQQGYCGVYAHALQQLYPQLSAGSLDQGMHYFAHDDKYAYDSLGRHPLPYHGINGDMEMQLYEDLADYGEPWDAVGPEGIDPHVAEAIEHIKDNDILNHDFDPNNIPPDNKKWSAYDRRQYPNDPRLVGERRQMPQGGYPDMCPYCGHLMDGPDPGECPECGWRMDPLERQWIESKTSMAERTGVQELDALIEEFINENPTVISRQGDDYGHLHDFEYEEGRYDPSEIPSDPEKAVDWWDTNPQAWQNSTGNCALLTGFFIDWLRSKGISAYSTNSLEAELGNKGWKYDPHEKGKDSLGYDNSPEPGNPIDNTHCAVALDWGGQTFLIDWTATQYGHKEWPMVKRLTPERRWKEKWSMAESTGEPKIDALIDSFKEHNPTIMNCLYSQLMEREITLNDMNHPGFASGNCGQVSQLFADWCRDQGVKAYSYQTTLEGSAHPFMPTDKFDEFGHLDIPAYHPDFWGYQDRRFDGYPGHDATMVQGDNGWYMVDWSAAQYGFKEFPMVQRIDDVEGLKPEDRPKWQRHWSSVKESYWLPQYVAAIHDPDTGRVAVANDEDTSHNDLLFGHNMHGPQVAHWLYHPEEQRLAIHEHSRNGVTPDLAAKDMERAGYPVKYISTWGSKMLPNGGRVPGILNSKKVASVKQSKVKNRYTDPSGGFLTVADGKLFNLPGYYANDIKVPEELRGQGIGTRLFNQLIADADAEGAPVHLEVYPHGDMNKDELKQWYHTLGFKELNPDWDGLMTREPSQGRTSAFYEPSNPSDRTSNWNKFGRIKRGLAS